MAASDVFTPSVPTIPSDNKLQSPCPGDWTQSVSSAVFGSISAQLVVEISASYGPFNLFLKQNEAFSVSEGAE